ncbi:hypothetical protein [Methylocystis sp. S23]
MLAEVCEQIASGASGRSALDYSAVQRFAKTDLGDEIRQLLKTYASSEELRGFLVRMIWLGQLAELLPEARAIALSPAASTYTRLSAIQAVKSVGTKQDHFEICRSFAAEAPPLNRKLLSELIADLEPSAENIDWLFAVLENVEPKERFSFDELTDSIAGFVSSASIGLLPSLLVGLNQLLERSPVIERHYCEVSQNYIWLMKAAATGVERLIHARNPEALEDDALEILKNSEPPVDGRIMRFPKLGLNLGSSLPLGPSLIALRFGMTCGKRGWPWMATPKAA